MADKIKIEMNVTAPDGTTSPTTTSTTSASKKKAKGLSRKSVSSAANAAADQKEHREKRMKRNELKQYATMGRGSKKKTSGPVHNVFENIMTGWVMAEVSQ